MFPISMYIFTDINQSVSLQTMELFWGSLLGKRVLNFLKYLTTFYKLDTHLFLYCLSSFSSWKLLRLSGSSLHFFVAQGMTLGCIHRGPNLEIFLTFLALPSNLGLTQSHSDPFIILRLYLPFNKYSRSTFGKCFLESVYTKFCKM